MQGEAADPVFHASSEASSESEIPGPCSIRDRFVAGTAMALTCPVAAPGLKGGYTDIHGASQGGYP